MIIQWLGKSSFKIQTKGQGDEVTIAMDPFTDGNGLKMSRFNADIVTMSRNNENHNNIDAIRGEPFVITSPGEYETKGVFIYGIAGIAEENKKKDKATICKIVSEEVSVVHLSSISDTLSNDQIDQLGNVDVLLIPVGNAGTLDAKKASEIITQIDPRIVVPMNFKVEGQKTDLNTVDGFIKHCGLKSETMEKLRVQKKDLMAEDTRVVVLTI